MTTAIRTDRPSLTHFLHVEEVAEAGRDREEEEGGDGPRAQVDEDGPEDEEDRRQYVGRRASVQAAPKLRRDRESVRDAQGFLAFIALPPRPSARPARRAGPRDGR